MFSAQFKAIQALPPGRRRHASRNSAINAPPSVRFVPSVAAGDGLAKQKGCFLPNSKRIKPCRMTVSVTPADTRSSTSPRCASCPLWLPVIALPFLSDSTQFKVVVPLWDRAHLGLDSRVPNARLCISRDSRSSISFIFPKFRAFGRFLPLRVPRSLGMLPAGSPFRENSTVFRGCGIVRAAGDSFAFHQSGP